MGDCPNRDCLNRDFHKIYEIIKMEAGVKKNGTKKFYFWGIFFAPQDEGDTIFRSPIVLIHDSEL